MSLKKPSHSWWFDSHCSQRRSTWLHSTLSELDEKTKTMLKLIEEDADSFAQRAEMYYKKRPELVYMVEDFYRAHRSLAERYDQLKQEFNMQLKTMPPGPPFSSKNSSQYLKNLTDKSSMASSYSFDSEDYEVDDPEQEEVQVDRDMGKEVSSKDPSAHRSLAERYRQLKLAVNTRLMTTRNLSQKLKKLTDKSSIASSDSLDSSEVSEVDDPVLEETQVDREMGGEVPSKVGCDSEVLKLREEIERLKEENRIQKAELIEKNDEKRQVIRQLCMSLDILKEENVSLRKCLQDSKKISLFEETVIKLKRVLSGKST
ncbi:protein NETWORKED 3A-like isoform X2 [Tasmannia lanceolata]